MKLELETLGQGLAVGLLSLALAACGESFSAAQGKDAGADAGGGQGAGGSSGGASGGAAGHGGQAPGTGGAPAERDASQGGTAGDRDGGPKPTPDAGTVTGKDAGGVPFVVPTDGLLLWLRADRGITEVSGRISTWADQSGHHLDAIQPDPNLGPHLVTSSGKAGVEFDGADDFLQMPAGFSDFSKGLSIFLVVQPASILTCQSFVEFSNGSEIDDISLGVYQEQLLYEVVDPYTQATPIVVGTPQEITLTHAADGAVVLRRNGALAQKTNFALPEVLERVDAFVGKSLYSGCDTFGGRISELLIYDRAVVGTDLTRIEQTLRDRWNCCTD